ncbi:D-alanine--D-alanine ligase [Actinomadura pelletieri DSM 43383]|uniref:D-alanine--D-alanine ligase n=1 Tax=Actinomadura pelletieri DSM 43383 TaxID=1120940 RepID=A0A495QG76_9ACTN|nr:D-alanine--D-alanine ligase [Actinomadura pelletieri]RKS70885.1 D-alanine--D-alanine ligase [Actinomadura pelletieri DSM 43383]
MTRRIVVVGGGENAEHDVSVATAGAIARGLREGGFDVEELIIDRDGTWRAGAAALGSRVACSLAAALGVIERADVVFPAVHGPSGEDGTLAALCALAHVRMVGSALRAGAVGMDKWTTKLVAQAVNIRTAPGRLVAATDIAGIGFEKEVVVKPASAGSSYGVALARDAAELREALCHAARFDDRILVEDVVAGREIDVAVLREADGRRWASPPLEIHADGLFDTQAKYDGSARFTVPADLDAADRAALTDAALRMFDALGCAGVARIDFFLTDHGPVLNEINTMPGMTAHSQVPRMFAAAGLPYPGLLARLVDAATVPDPTGAVRRDS